MADAKLTALTAASALAGADLFYVSQSAASRKATGTQLLALVGTTYVPLAGGTMTGALTIASGTLTASAPALSITQTWTTGAEFTGALMNITDTSSTSTSKFLDFQVAGSSKFSVEKTGTVRAPVGAISGYSLGAHINGAVYWHEPADLILWRDAAATLAQRNGTTQQIFRLYNTYTDSSNYERLTLTGVAGASVNITAETLGTGGDNIDIVLTPAGTGQVKFPGGALITPSIVLGPTNTGLYANSGGQLNLLSDGTVMLSLEQPSNGVRIASAYSLGWSSSGGANSNSIDAGFSRNAAGIVEVNNGTAGTWRDLKLRNLIQTEYSQLTEMTAPSAPATNSVRIYAEDDGAGKTRLMALFATGAAQQIAIEP